MNRSTPPRGAQLSISILSTHRLQKLSLIQEGLPIVRNFCGCTRLMKKLLRAEFGRRFLFREALG